MDRVISGKSGCSIFVPLCGKTLDLIWLNEKGHTVMGCELSEVAAKQFFEENKIPYSTSGLYIVFMIRYYMRQCCCYTCICVLLVGRVNY